MKRQLNTRVTKITREQVDEIAGEWEMTVGDVIALAIERLYQQFVARKERENRPVTTHVTQDMKDRVLSRDNRTCQYCGNGDGPKSYIVVDHVISASRGGHGRLYNLVAACQSCNCKKRGKTWIPNNLDAITEQNPKWRARILEAVGDTTKL